MYNKIIIKLYKYKLSLIIITIIKIVVLKDFYTYIYKLKIILRTYISVFKRIRVCMFIFFLEYILVDPNYNI